MRSRMRKLYSIAFLALACAAAFIGYGEGQKGDQSESAQIPKAW
jgi:hypothetical protein